jgi:hypothetical protein
MLLSDLWFTLRGELTPTQIRKANQAAQRAELERAATEAAQADLRHATQAK